MPEGQYWKVYAGRPLYARRPHYARRPVPEGHFSIFFKKKKLYFSYILKK